MPPFRSPKTLEISGYEQVPVPCVLHSSGGESGVAVVFPGAGQQGNRLGSTPARPDLHYTRAVLQAEGLAVFEVWWDGGSLPKDDREGWLDGLEVDNPAASARHLADVLDQMRGFVARATRARQPSSSGGG
jgi:hypothetical protein